MLPRIFFQKISTTELHIHENLHRPHPCTSSILQFPLLLYFSPTMSLLKKVSQAQIRQVKQLSAQIFGESYNPDNIRNGAKVLAAPLKGPAIASYYGDNNSTPTFKDFKQWFPELKLVDPKEEYRVMMVALRKKRNKGAPKKKTS